jgi:protein-disulfide isomerase
LRQYAADIGLDTAKFDDDRAGPLVLGRIRRDINSGLASGEVQGTPALFINGVAHRGGYDAATLLQALAL